jgi:hypothetical protein
MGAATPVQGSVVHGVQGGALVDRDAVLEDLHLDCPRRHPFDLEGLFDGPVIEP